MSGGAFFSWSIFYLIWLKQMKFLPSKVLSQQRPRRKALSLKKKDLVYNVLRPVLLLQWYFSSFDNWNSFRSTCVTINNKCQTSFSVRLYFKSSKHLEASEYLQNTLPNNVSSHSPFSCCVGLIFKGSRKRGVECLIS